LEETEKVIKEEVEKDSPSLIVTKGHAFFFEESLKSITNP